jgi:hypothetical protein
VACLQDSQPVRGILKNSERERDVYYWGNSPVVRTMAVRACQRRGRSSSATPMVNKAPHPLPPTEEGRPGERAGERPTFEPLRERASERERARERRLLLRWRWAKAEKDIVSSRKASRSEGDDLEECDLRAHAPWIYILYWNTNAHTSTHTHTHTHTINWNIYWNERNSYAVGRLVHWNSYAVTKLNARSH